MKSSRRLISCSLLFLLVGCAYDSSKEIECRMQLIKDGKTANNALILCDPDMMYYKPPKKEKKKCCVCN